jgi:hypothetical protein
MSARGIKHFSPEASAEYTRFTAYPSAFLIAAFSIKAAPFKEERIE